MKLAYLICAIILLIPIKAVAQMGGISFFKGSWPEAIEEAKKQNKYIFLDAYTIWCAPCKRMEREVFTSPEAGDFYNSRFINYQLDMEKGLGRKVAQDYNIRFYPTLLYLNPEGKLVHKVVGFRPAAELVKDGQAALNQNSQLFELQERYERGEAEPEFLRMYAQVAKEAGENDWQKIAAKYFRTQKDADLVSPENWEAIQLFTVDIQSREYKYLTAHKEDFIRRYDAEMVFSAIARKTYDASLSALEEGNDKRYEEALDVLKNMSHPVIDKYIYLSQMDRAMRDKNWEKFCTVASKYGMEYAWHNASELNNLAWQIMTNCPEEQSLLSAMAMIDHSVELEKTYANLDTKAWILYKLKRVPQARDAGEEALKVANETNEDATSTIRLFREMAIEEK